jgi:hypothetical protein
VLLIGNLKSYDTSLAVWVWQSIWNSADYAGGMARVKDTEQRDDAVVGRYSLILILATV